MWDENIIYPKIEAGYAYADVMNDELVEKFNTNNFTQGSAIIKIRYSNPKNLIVQYLPVEERKQS